LDIGPPLASLPVGLEALAEAVSGIDLTACHFSLLRRE
jgi:hypothetical protein